MTFGTKANIFFLVLFVLMVAAILVLCHVSRAEGATLYIFGNTAAKDGTITTTRIIPSCEDGWMIATVNRTGIVATSGTNYDADNDYGIGERGFLSANTSVLAGKTVISAYWKLVVHDKYNLQWNTNVQCDFRKSCISTNLAAVDTTCFVTADITIAWASIPAVHDTATGCIINLYPSDVSTTGATELILRSSNEANVCAVTARSDVQFYTIEAATANYRPRLYVTVADEMPASGPTFCTFHNARLQTQVNSSTPKRLKIGTPGRGLGRFATS